MKQYLYVGQVLKPQGIQGEVKVLPATDNPERFLQLEQAYLDDRGEKTVTITGARVQAGFAYLTVEGVTGRDAAERLRGQELYVDRAHAAPLPEGRYFLADLEGMAVVDGQGNALGALVQVIQAGGNDVYEVKGPRTFRFPALKRVIRRVDVEKGVMELDAAALEQVAVYDDAD